MSLYWVLDFFVNASIIFYPFFFLHVDDFIIVVFATSMLKTEFEHMEPTKQGTVFKHTWKPNKFLLIGIKEKEIFYTLPFIVLNKTIRSRSPLKQDALTPTILNLFMPITNCCYILPRIFQSVRIYRNLSIPICFLLLFR